MTRQRGRSVAYASEVVTDAILRAVGRRMQLARETAGLSTRELARRAGVTHSVLSRAECGEACTVVTLVRVARAVGADVGTLFAEGIRLNPRS